MTSALVDFVDQLYGKILPSAGVMTLASLAVCVGWGLWRAYPPVRVRRDFKQPEMTVMVAVGDLFAQPDAHLVAGFSDTFDTSIEENRIIDGGSVQGQLLTRLYDGDCGELDHALDIALMGTAPIERESKHRKDGKLDRYPIGTVAVLPHQQRHVFAVAYARMDNTLVAHATLDDIWHSLNMLWAAIYRHGQHGPVAMPLIGSGLARVDYIERESLLKMIIMSFVASSRQRLVCRELRILLRPSDLDHVNMAEVRAFMRNL